MKSLRILVTGGAGFIGSFLVDKLIDLGHSIVIIDNLEEQVHRGKKPNYLNPRAIFIKGDVRDLKTLTRQLVDIDVIFHLAARVGVAQSNYEIKDYVDTNIGGIANLLELLLIHKNKIKKVIMTASMTSYGEGLYLCSRCGKIKPPLRPVSKMKKHDWELHCPNCQKIMQPIPTPEDSLLSNNSIYSLTKNFQEELLLHFGKIYGVPVVSLRCFNVYGPRQSLSNPYTGVTAIFMSRLKNNRPPILYEDGLQTRDFVSIHDVVSALIATLKTNRVDYQAVNIGSGEPTSIKEIAVVLTSLLNKKIKPRLSHQFRQNDIRHCFADITKAKTLLGWQPKISLVTGMKELISWSEKQKAQDQFKRAAAELKLRKLVYD